MNIVVDALLVGPGGVFMLDEALSWRLMLSLGAWHVITVEDVVHSRHGRQTIITISSRNHLIHYLLELFLDIFCLLT